jgi:excisionase family DNA binding protein
MPTTPTAPEPAASEPLVSVQVLARQLGVPASWVYERTARSAIPHYRVGRYVRFRVSEVLDWLTAEAEREEAYRG